MQQWTRILTSDFTVTADMGFYKATFWCITAGPTFKGDFTLNGLASQELPIPTSGGFVLQANPNKAIEGLTIKPNGSTVYFIGYYG